MDGPLKKSHSYHHYTRMNPCEDDPDLCKNGTCVIDSNGLNYVCHCRPGYKGDRCQYDCSKPFGMQDGRILNSQITASSSYSNDVAPWNGRLYSNLGSGAWAPSKATVGEYLQIDLGSKKTVYEVATQGRYSNYHRVTKYTLQYSDNGTLWANYTINGAIQFPGSCRKACNNLTGKVFEVLLLEHVTRRRR
ncbi:hypothetical protein QZH41_007911 [Actinostola sp. cb2023]|nr:hypothetical protein QZH41_007911 [Actinostola sp. cb2023]